MYCTKCGEKVTEETETLADIRKTVGELRSRMSHFTLELDAVVGVFNQRIDVLESTYEYERKAVKKLRCNLEARLKRYLRFGKTAKRLDR